MKKKVLMAVLALSVVLSAAGCGTSTEKADKAADKETTADENSSAKDASEEDAADEDTSEKEGEEEKKETNKDSSPTRLVSVKDIDKYITIGDYKGLALENTVEAVADEDVEAEIEYEMQNHAEEVTGSKETVQTGDMVTINFVGLKDGEAFDGGTADNYDLTIGEGGMLDGFEDGIIGMKKGETKEVPLTFPEDYMSEELAGEDVVFKITLQSFRRAPELTDEWVAENLDYSTVDEYKEGVRANLEANAQENAKYTMYTNAWSMVLENSEIIEFPQEEIDNCINEFKKQVEVYAQQADMELMDFVESQGYTEESFEDECRQYAEYKVKQNLIVQGIMDAENISLDDDECLAIQDELIAAYGAESLADLIDQYGQASVDESIGLLRVERFIVDNAEVTEMVSDGDQVGVNGDIEDTSVDAGEEIIEDVPEEEDGNVTEDTGEDGSDE